MSHQHQICHPLPFLALLALWRGKRWALTWLLLPLLLFATDYGPLFLPRGSSAQGPTLRVMTTNLHFYNHSLAAVADTIKTQQPDVLVVQELGSEMAGYLTEKLKANYPYQARSPSWAPYGTAIFSRYPLSAPAAPSPGLKGCYCQTATIDFNGRPVGIINVHTRHPEISPRQPRRSLTEAGPAYASQKRALLAIRDLAEASAGPTLAVGDFNLTDHEEPYRQLTRRLKDSFREVGFGLGYTYPNKPLFHLSSIRLPAIRLPAIPLPTVPLIRIDHVLHSDAWAARAAWTVAMPGSDHQAVVADLVLVAH